MGEERSDSYQAIVDRAMLSGLLLAAVVIGALSCPVLMLLGRRGIGPGCALMGCKPRRRSERPDDAATLRARHNELTRRIAQVEAREGREPRAPASQPS